jgi:uncharacterized protein with GYD domain
MPTYIVLFDWTGQGIEDVSESPRRLDGTREVFTAHGGDLREFYMTMGGNDGVLIASFPDDAACASAVLEVARAGNVRTKTLKAFTEAEFREITGAL